MKNAKVILLAVGLFLAVLSAPVYTLAVENSGVGGKPANPRADNPRTESIFVHELDAGATVSDAVNVINNTDQPKIVEVYGADAQVASGGAFACEQKADIADSEGSWIKVAKSTVSLGPNGNEIVPFTITVPKDAAVGEHNACIAMQAVEAPVESGVNGVQLSFRSAIRVAVTVKGEITKALTFESLKTTQHDRILTVTEQLYNSGNVSLDVELKTQLKSLTGSVVETVEGQYPILSAQRAEFNFDFTKPNWGGFYKVVSVATYNNDTSSSLGEQSDGANKKGEVAIEKMVFIVPNTTAIFVYAGIFIVIVTVITVLIRRRLLMNNYSKESISHTVAKGEDIMSIASKYGASWKLVAKENKLRAPYSLTVGQEIKVRPLKKAASTSIVKASEGVDKNTKVADEPKQVKKVVNIEVTDQPKKKQTKAKQPKKKKSGVATKKTSKKTTKKPAKKTSKKPAAKKG
jgi:hypothetical protein